MRPTSNTTIEGWLEEIDLNVISATEHTNNPVFPTHEGTSRPSTPLLRSNKIFNETSPTDTSFSANTIFDTPAHSNSYLSATPSSDHNVQDTSSDITTAYNEPHYATTKNKQDPLSQSTRPNTPTTSPTPPRPSTSAQTHTPAQPPRLVSLTLCLQCILERLPCSRTYPSCTRCARNGHADTCLLHRRRFACEPGSGPVLLRVKGEDDDVWARKERLREALWGEWVAGRERRNWVLPCVFGVRGGWSKGTGRMRDEWQGPGEGAGRVVLRELVVELEG